MKPVEFHWYIKENKLAISLMRFHVSIDPKIDEETLQYKMKIVDSSMDNISLNFNSLEEAMTFTEEIVSKKTDIEEISEEYNKPSKNKIKRL